MHANRVLADREDGHPAQLRRPSSASTMWHIADRRAYCCSSAAPLPSLQYNDPSYCNVLAQRSDLGVEASSDRPAATYCRQHSHHTSLAAYFRWNSRSNDRTGSFRIQPDRGSAVLSALCHAVSLLQRQRPAAVPPCPNVVRRIYPRHA